MPDPGNLPPYPATTFVYMVESPAPDDLFDGRTEGRVLCEALNLAGIKSWYRLASNSATLDRALNQELLSASQSLQALPILHFSMHGNGEGVGLTDGGFLSWQDLRNRLVPINRALNGALIVSISSCFGAAGCRMAMRENEPLPFLALVGHQGSPTWSDAAVGFVAFYHRLFRGAGVKTALEAMHSASGDAGFCVQLGKEIHANWVDYMQKERLNDFFNALVGNALGTPVPAPSQTSR